MDILYWSLISIAGLCFGSFINVLIHRTQTGESILFPASKCPKCDVPLLWWQNIPLFSYFYLNGRCYYCNKIISIQYPIVEFLGLVLFVFSFSVYKSIIDAICVIGILSILFVQSVIDVRIRKLSTAQSIVIAVLGIIFNRYDILSSIAGMLACGLIIYGIKKLAEKYLDKEIFGDGDILLFGALGSIVCFDKIFLYMFYTFLFQVAIYLPLRWKLLTNNDTNLGKNLKIFGIACLFLYIIKNFDFWGANIVYAGIFGLILYYAYLLVKELFSTLKTNETTPYCALAPAITIACIVFLI